MSCACEVLAPSVAAASPLCLLPWWLGLPTLSAGCCSLWVAASPWINLRLAFSPACREPERRKLGRRHFMRLARSVLEMGISLVGAGQTSDGHDQRVEGREHLDDHQGAAGYHPDAAFCWPEHGRCQIRRRLARFDGVLQQAENPLLTSCCCRAAAFRHAGAVRQAGWPAPGNPQNSRWVPFVFLPDMDFGRTDSVFVPFLVHDCATVTTLSRLAQLTKAPGSFLASPASCRRPKRGVECASIRPGTISQRNMEADARRMNEFIQAARAGNARTSITGYTNVFWYSPAWRAQSLQISSTIAFCRFPVVVDAFPATVDPGRIGNGLGWVLPNWRAAVPGSHAST